MAALAEPQAAQRPPRPPPPPFRLPSRFDDTSDLWHTLAEGFWIHVEEDRWVWDFVGVDYISGSIETEPPNPELHVHAYLAETPGPLEISDNYWSEHEWDNDFAAEFNGAAATGALDQAERPTKRAKINEELGTGEDLQPRAPGSCPRARLAHLRRLIEAKRAGGWFPDLAPFVFERSAGETPMP